MKIGKGLLDQPGVRERIAKKVEEVKKLHFSNGRPLIIGENGKMFKLYEDGRKEEIKSSGFNGEAKHKSNVNKNDTSFEK